MMEQGNKEIIFRCQNQECKKRVVIEVPVEEWPDKLICPDCGKEYISK